MLFSGEFKNLHLHVLAITGDMGWAPCEIKWKGSMIALWNRLIRMPENRVAKKVFNCDVSISAVEDILIRTVEFF